MKPLVALATAALLLITGSASGAGSGVAAIEQHLRASPSVSFYFVSRTGDYDYDPGKVKSEASVVVRRSCGANCHNFMGPVIASLRVSKRSKCLPGQQDLLITFGSAHLVYSYSGRQAKYQGKCYFNPESIHKLLKNDGFFFQ